MLGCRRENTFTTWFTKFFSFLKPAWISLTTIGTELMEDLWMVEVAPFLISSHVLRGCSWDNIVICHGPYKYFNIYCSEFLIYVAYLKEILGRSCRRIGNFNYFFNKRIFKIILLNQWLIWIFQQISKNIYNIFRGIYPNSRFLVYH